MVSESIILTLTEFNELYRTSRKGEKTGGILCSVFIDPENLFCLHVPDGFPLEKIFSKVPQINHFMNTHPESRAYNPISGKIFDIA